MRATRAAKSALRAGLSSTAAVRELPDFLIVGTKRGGSTSLYNYVLAHPDVMPLVPSRQNLKGLYFFDVNYARGDTWYRSHFMTSARRHATERRRGHRVLLGESTPYYLYHPHAPRRAAELAPDARIIMLLRDPVERAYSHYKERWRQGVEPLTFEKALAAEPKRLEGEFERMLSDPGYRSFAHQMFSYVDQGRYLDGVRRWQQSYPDNQILILRSEDLYADPAHVVGQVQRFLGLDPVQLDSYEAWNQKPAKGMSPEVRAELTKRLAPDVRRLEDHLRRDMDWL